jgi:hypothetical protein
LADRELDILRDTLREHVGALTVDIGPRTPSTSNSLLRAANYIHSVFENAGLTATEQDYDYYDQRVTNVLATVPATAGLLPITLSALTTTPSRARRAQMTMRVGSRSCWS